MRKMRVLFLFLSSALLSTCCLNSPPLVVHVAGYYNAGSNDIAAYWKNDAAGVQGLYTATGARALGVAVSGVDVYAAGYYTNTKPNLAACFWKNGVLFDLYTDTSGTNSARANAIAVSGADVYVAGWVDLGVRSACYWKNGVRTDLPGAVISEGLGIAVSGTDVYVAGYYNAGSNDVACYWKNNAAGKVDLYTAHYSRAAAITVSETDVYASGYYQPAVTGLACYWKNNLAGKVDLSTVNSNAASIVVSGTDVYVAGRYRNISSKDAACWWKNNAASKVDLYSDTVNQAQGLGIFVDRAVVYVAGQVNQGTPGACYWKDGVRTDLYASGTSWAYSICCER